MDAIVKKYKHITSCQLGNKGMIFSFETLASYEVNEIGILIFNLINNKRRVSDIVKKLQKTYNTKEINKHVLEFLSSLKKEKIIFY